MQHIILEAHHTNDGVVFDISHLEARLNQLIDSRDKRGKIYPLGMILTEKPCPLSTRRMTRRL